MIKFEGKIVQFGFGAVGKSFYEKVSKEIKFDENNYFVITRYTEEFHDYANLGGLVVNFITCEITKENFQSIFKKYLNSGDLLIDFADTVGTSDICDWCAQKNIMYLNTGVADWPENWLNIFEQDRFLSTVKEKHYNNPLTCKYPIVLQHGNNPGLVSHFVKAGIEYIIKTQHKKNKQLKKLLAQNKFNEAAQVLGIKMIHVNDIDSQKIKNIFPDNTLANTWCVDTFLFEMLTEATINIGNHEEIDFADECKNIDVVNGFLEFKDIATEKKCRTYYPGGLFEGYLVPHEETITIAKGLEVKHNNELVYRPSVMFIYTPCDLANTYLSTSKVNDYPIPDQKKPMDSENENGQIIIRGHVYPKQQEIVYKEHIASGTEHVGVLLIGDNFDPVWVGNRIEPSFLYKKKKDSFWQTPTITPVAMSALAAVCWMIKNKDKGGFYLPDDIIDYKYILKVAEKYISKTIYKTFE
ncbi:MAG: saccharopine dehydrogenase NADP-binding domain-containing protein [Coprobacillaceae bacterium]